jgi:Tol biopolymer transport system component
MAVGEVPFSSYENAVAGPSRRLVEVPGFWPLGLDKGRAVSINFQDQEVYLTDLSTGEITQISQDGVQKVWAALSGDIVTWISSEGQIELPAEEITSDSADNHLFVNHIYVYDLNTGEQRRITGEDAPRTQLAVDGQRLVWADKRNELGAFYADYDIYAYDLETDVETPVAVAPGEQQFPRIDGDLLIWLDNRANPDAGGDMAGCSNCPENRKDIYLYDFETGTSRPLVEDQWLKMTPTIRGGRVTWIGFPGQKEGDVFVMELETGEIKQVTHTPDPESNPQLDGDRLLWVVISACDAIAIDALGREITFDNGAYLLDMKSGSLQRLSGETEPLAFIAGGQATLTEGCMTGYETFVVELDE